MLGHENKPFRVIVVGGGVAGLVASHALQKANIEHVVLEKGDGPAPLWGASIAIYPHGCRILEQIGCLEAARRKCVPGERYVNRMPNGKVCLEADFWKQVSDRHGYDLLLMERREYLELLYENLPDKSKVLFGKKVKRIAEDAHKIEVLLDDGTSEMGDMVLGCDGVHSKVRELMWENALREDPAAIPVEEKTAIKTTYSCLVGMSAAVPGLGNELSCVHNRGYSFLIASQPDRTFWFVFFSIEKPYSQYTRPKWTDADAEKAAVPLLDHPLTESVVFGELWRKRFRAHMIDIEEGVLNKWHHGRIVLAGDVVHKVTPNMALGGNSAMESVVELVNSLHRLKTSHPNRRPSRATLSAAFQKYQQSRIARMQEIMEFSSLITNVSAWNGVWNKLLALYVFPNSNKATMADKIAEILRKAPKLDFVPLREHKQGSVQWADEVPQNTTTKTSSAHVKQMPFVGLVVALLSLCVLYASKLGRLPATFV